MWYTNIYRIRNEFSFQTVFMKRAVCFVSPSLWRGDIKYTTSFKIPYEMKIHFRFFLSHDNCGKYQYFMKKVCIFRKFRAKIALKCLALCDVIMLLLMTSLAKKHQTGEKRCYVTCFLLENL